MCLSFSSAAHVPLFLYPFLNTSSKTRPFEYLRLTSLGVIGALVKVCKASVSIHAKLPCSHAWRVTDAIFDAPLLCSLNSTQANL